MKLKRNDLSKKDKCFRCGNEFKHLDPVVTLSEYDFLTKDSPTDEEKVKKVNLFCKECYWNLQFYEIK